MNPRARRGVSFTAAGVATIRARLVRPSASEGRDVGRALAADLHLRTPLHRNKALVGYLAGRTRFFDGVVAEAVTHPGTVVLVGAGYDDRCFRFATPGVRFVEIDHPATQCDKRERLDRLGVDSSAVRFVPADLEHDRLDDLTSNVEGEAGRITFICEAVLPYLSSSRVEAVLTALARCPGSTLLGADLPVRPVALPGRLAVAVLRASTAAVGEPIRTIINSETELAALLQRSGWREQARTTGRDLDMPPLARDALFLRLLPGSSAP